MTGIARFRAFETDDAIVCLELFDANCPDYFAVNERDDYREFLATNGVGYQVCEWDREVVGAYGLFDEDGALRLNWILIHPRFHGKGIGASIMNRILIEAGRSSIGLVRIAASHKSAPFFAKFGAVRLRVTPDGWGPGMNRVDMELATE